MVIPVAKPIVTPDEKKYREDTFPDVKEIKNKNLLCTSCGTSVKDLIAKGKPICHPFLETLLCEKCFSFYGDGDFSVDEDGSDKYCRWCGQGGTLFLCSKCSSGFCKRCVKRNVPRSALADIEEDDWLCYCCNATPLFELRAQCWAAQQYALEIKQSSKSSSKNRKSSLKRPHGSSDEEEEVTKSKTKDSESEDEKGKDEDHKRKRKRKDEPKKSDTKRDRSKNENGDAERGSKRSLRERKTKKDDDNFISESGISKDHLKSVISQFNKAVVDCAGITKEVHKKMLECKAKLLNFNNINSFESVTNMRNKITSMLVLMENSSSGIRNALDDYCRDWEQTVQTEMGINKNERTEGGGDEESVENGVPDTSEKAVDSTQSSEPKDNVTSKEDETVDSTTTDDKVKEVNDDTTEKSDDTQKMEVDIARDAEGEKSSTKDEAEEPEVGDKKPESVVEKQDSEEAKVVENVTSEENTSKDETSEEPSEKKSDS